MLENRKTDQLIDGVGKKDFEIWKHHPVTKVFRRFLQDYRGAIKTRILEQWEGGALKLTDELEARGRVRVVQEMIDLEFEHILSQYGIEGTGNGSEEDIGGKL